jgi:hypothetical protein
MQSWLNIIPSIDLEKGTPIVPVVRGWGSGPFLFVRMGRGSNVNFSTPRDGIQGARPSDFRIDLNSPEGFDYALKWTIENSGTPKTPKHKAWEEVFDRHRTGKTTNNDRLFLAETMADFALSG